MDAALALPYEGMVRAKVQSVWYAGVGDGEKSGLGVDAALARLSDKFALDLASELSCEGGVVALEAPV